MTWRLNTLQRLEILWQVEAFGWGSIEHFVQGLLTAETHENLNFGQIYTHPIKMMGNASKGENSSTTPPQRGGIHKRHFLPTTPSLRISLSTPSVSTCVRLDEAQAPPCPTPNQKHRDGALIRSGPPCSSSSNWPWTLYASHVDSPKCLREATSIPGHRVGKHPNTSCGALEFPDVIHEVGGEVKCLRHRFAKIGLKGVYTAPATRFKRTYPTPSLLAQKSIPSSSLSSTVNR